MGFFLVFVIESQVPPLFLPAFRSYSSFFPICFKFKKTYTDVGTQTNAKSERRWDAVFKHVSFVVRKI